MHAARAKRRCAVISCYHRATQGGLCKAHHKSRPGNPLTTTVQAAYTVVGEPPPPPPRNIMTDTKSATSPKDQAELDRKLKERGDQTKGAPVTKPGGAAVTK